MPNVSAFDLIEPATGKPMGRVPEASAEDVDRAVAMLRGAAGAEVILPPTDSEWGRRAIVADPDGHRVELDANDVACLQVRVDPQPRRDRVDATPL